VRRIINSAYISLDGVIENPQDWPGNGTDPDGTGLKAQTGLLFACDAVLTGRRTHPGFAAAWTARSGGPYSDRINSMTRYVASSTLRDPERNNTTVISGDPIAEIRRLKEQPGQDIVQYGFGQLSYALLEHGLTSCDCEPTRCSRVRPRPPACYSGRPPPPNSSSPARSRSTPAPPSSPTASPPTANKSNAPLTHVPSSHEGEEKITGIIWGWPPIHAPQGIGRRLRARLRRRRLAGAPGQTRPRARPAPSTTPAR
jgi:dihydrofolate reductase